MPVTWKHMKVSRPGRPGQTALGQARGGPGREPGVRLGALPVALAQ